MAETLTAADRSSLQAERGSVNMSVAGPMVFAPGQGSRYEAVLQRLDERLHLVPRYRQKLETPALGLTNPVWVDDSDFDLEWHVRHATLPSPGGPDQLAAYVAREMSRKLDRSRPLWELHVLDGFSDHRRVLIPKMHHAIVDGLAAVGIGMLLLDPSPDPLPIERPASDWTPVLYDRRRHLASLATGPLARAQKLMIDSTMRALDYSPRMVAEELIGAVDLVTELARQRPQAPMTPFNDQLSPNRKFAMHAASLTEVKEAGKRHGGTVNDVLLAAVTGMLDHYLKTARVNLGGKLPVALVPVSVRRSDEGHDVGNRISMVFVDLPVDEPTAAGRIGRIAEQTRKLIDSAAVRAGAMIAGAAGQVPPLVSNVLVRAMGNVRACNLVVSNIPGPQQPFYMNGTRMELPFPVVPLNPANQRLSVGILSYDGKVAFGILADSALSPGIDVAAQGLRDGLDFVLAG